MLRRSGRLFAAILLFALVLSSCVPVLDVRVQPVPGASVPAATEALEPTTLLESPGAHEIEAMLVALVTYMTLFAELCGAVVIGVGVIRALGRYVPHIWRRQPAGDTYSEDIRLQLGKSLALALEFELAADILKTAVAPTLTVIAQLAAIALLRTFLNYFLERELRQAEERRERQERRGGAEGLTRPAPANHEPQSGSS